MSTATSHRTSYLVLGAGISGLAAADEIGRLDPDAQVTVLEGSDRVGGKIRGAQLCGRPLDVGAEAFLVRRPEAVDLLDRAGLEDDLVHPTAAAAQIWSRDQIHPLPRRTLMGVPADVDALLGLLTEDEVARARAETTRRLEEQDTSVAKLVGDRLGPAVVERLVEPLLGGVYAGHADLLSARASLPHLVEVARQGGSLREAVARMMPASNDGTQARSASPVFGTVAGGLHRLPAELAAALTQRGVTIRTGTLVRELRRDDEGGFEVVTGPAPSPTAYRSDRVVIALPPAPTMRLLRSTAPEAADLLGTVETASMVVVTVALPSAELGELTGSGILVPPVDGRTIKAATFSASKWDWVRQAGLGAGPDGQDVTFLRASIGRHREEATLQRADGDLVGAALLDLAQALRRDLPGTLDAHVQRWGGGLPQYAVGHLDLVEQVRASVAEVPGMAVCGATYDGVGIPACIASARSAAAQVTL
ncbi:protoporphyrinogen oxidase [Ornithinimicrobium panacihumi]|uniref:protoporphyrinogen oxidase n=1 Tax=Ornithinimicrobium panacihumi TaxID=2008449 RepID=UPI003F8BDA40